MTATLMQRASIASSATATRPSSRGVVIPHAVLYAMPRRRAAYYPSSRPNPAPLVMGLVGGAMLASEWLKRSTAAHQPHQPVHIETTEAEYTLSADVPGMGDEDISVEVSPEGVLTISGSRQVWHSHAAARPRSEASTTKSSAEDEDPWFPASQEAGWDTAAASSSSSTSKTSSGRASTSSSRGSRTVRFSRSFVLPEDAEADAISADLDRGILTVAVPRKVQPKVAPKRVNVRTSTSKRPLA